MFTSSDFDEISSHIITLMGPDGSNVKISPYGAQVLSWQTADGIEHLFLSPKAEFRPGAAIRGGVPVIFPQFSGMGSLPKHGFARTRDWELARSDTDNAFFWLSENHETSLIWPHRFLVEYSIHLDVNSLAMALAITNTDVAPFNFTAALHTYLRVQDVSQAAVLGLKGFVYEDSTNHDKESLQEADRVIFQGELDRIYKNTSDPLELIEGSRHVRIQTKGFTDSVIWNPGPQKCAQMSDMEPDGYFQFVCVEAAAVGEAVQLAPGGNWSGKQILSL
jgi:glucose-6-phosphate 1-epimerase